MLMQHYHIRLLPTVSHWTTQCRTHSEYDRVRRKASKTATLPGGTRNNSLVANRTQYCTDDRQSGPISHQLLASMQGSLRALGHSDTHAACISACQFLQSNSVILRACVHTIISIVKLLRIAGRPSTHRRKCLQTGPYYLPGEDIEPFTYPVLICYHTGNARRPCCCLQLRRAVLLRGQRRPRRRGPVTQQLDQRPGVDAVARRVGRVTRQHLGVVLLQQQGGRVGALGAAAACLFSCFVDGTKATVRNRLRILGMCGCVGGLGCVPSSRHGQQQGLEGWERPASFPGLRGVDTVHGCHAALEGTHARLQGCTVWVQGRADYLSMATLHHCCMHSSYAGQMASVHAEVNALL